MGYIENNTVRVEISWDAGGDCPIPDDERADRAEAIMDQLRDYTLPANEDEYAKLTERLESIASAEYVQPMNWEGAAVHVIDVRTNKLWEKAPAHA